MNDMTPGAFSIRSPPAVSSMDIDWKNDVFDPVWKAHPSLAHSTSSSVHGLLEGSTAEHGRRDPQIKPSRGKSPTPRARATTPEFRSPISAGAGGARGDSGRGQKFNDAQQLQEPCRLQTGSTPGPINQEEQKNQTKEADKVQVQDWPQMHSFQIHSFRICICSII